MAREWFEQDHPGKLDATCAMELREHADAAINLAVAEYADNSQGWHRLHPDGKEGVRLIRFACYIGVGTMLFEGRSPEEIRTAMRRKVAGAFDALGPGSPDARAPEMAWELATETIDRALHIYQTADRPAVLKGELL